MSKKLFKVNLRGLSSVTGINYQESYVVAEHATEAYEKIRAFLDTEDYGFDHERELLSVTLLAEDNRYTDVKTRLFL